MYALADFQGTKELKGNDAWRWLQERGLARRHSDGKWYQPEDYRTWQYMHEKKLLFWQKKINNQQCVSVYQPPSPQPYNPCGQVLSNQETDYYGDWYWKTIVPSWGNAKGLGKITLETYVGLGRYITASKRTQAQLEVWKRKVNCYNACAHAYPKNKPSKHDTKRLQECIKLCRAMKYPQCN